MNIGLVLNDVGPYHACRIEAAMQLGSLSVIDCGAQHSVGYERVQGLPCRSIEVKALTRAALGAALAAASPDVLAVPGWGSRAARLATTWAAENDVPLIVFSDNQKRPDGSPGRWYWAKRILAGIYRAAVVAGTRHVMYMTRLGMPESAIFTGVDVVDNDYFARASEACRRDPAKLRRSLNLPTHYILAVNRLTAQKNIKGLIDSFELYSRRGCPGDLKLVIAGDGPLKESIAAHINSLGLEKEVFLFGAADYSTLPILHGLADLFVLASRQETWGLVVNEAMASGLPVLVSSDCGCCNDLVEDGRNGFVFDPRDSSDLAGRFIEFGEGRHDLGSMCSASREIISRWTPTRFADSLWKAAEIAASSDRRTPAKSRLLWGVLDRADRCMQLARSSRR